MFIYANKLLQNIKKKWWPTAYKENKAIISQIAYQNGQKISTIRELAQSQK